LQGADFGAGARKEIEAKLRAGQTLDEIEWRLKNPGKEFNKQQMAKEQRQKHEQQQQQQKQQQEQAQAKVGCVCLLAVASSASAWRRSVVML
jgi:uncharacterized membrane protein